MKVRDIMTSDVACVQPNATLQEAASIMQRYNIGSVPVCQNDQVVGIVTDRDIVIRNIANGQNPQTTNIQDVMTTEVKSVTPETEVESISNTMAQNQIRRVPVIENNRLVGMVSLGDLADSRNFKMEASEALTEISKPTRSN